MRNDMLLPALLGNIFRDCMPGVFAKIPKLSTTLQIILAILFKNEKKELLIFNFYISLRYDLYKN